MKNETLLYIIFAFVIFVIFLKRKTMTEEIKQKLIIAIILRHEGGYVNDPDDPGGETKYGISKRSYPNVDIKNLTREAATAIYIKDYYKKMGIDKIKNVNLAVNVMDMGVNAGVSIGLKLLYLATDQAERTGENIVTIYKNLRKKYYSELAEKKPALKKFLAGWLKRVDNSEIKIT